jgi:hypothetical protein
MIASSLPNAHVGCASETGLFYRRRAHCSSGFGCEKFPNGDWPEEASFVPFLNEGSATKGCVGLGGWVRESIPLGVHGSLVFSFPFSVAGAEELSVFLQCLEEIGFLQCLAPVPPTLAGWPMFSRGYLHRLVLNATLNLRHVRDPEVLLSTLHFELNAVCTVKLGLTTLTLSLHLLYFT